MMDISTIAGLLFLGFALGYGAAWYMRGKRAEADNRSQAYELFCAQTELDILKRSHEKLATQMCSLPLNETFHYYGKAVQLVPVSRLQEHTE